MLPVTAYRAGSFLLKRFANAATGDKKVNAYSDGSSLLKMLAKAATTKGDKKVKTRTSARGRYCREPYIVAMFAKPTTPRSINSHFLQNVEIEHSNDVSDTVQCTNMQFFNAIFQQCCHTAIPSQAVCRKMLGLQVVR